MIRHHKHLVVGAALALCPAVASSQVTTVAKEGDVVTGVGAITRIDNLNINNVGQWFVEADTNNPDTDADQVLVTNGLVLVLQEGGALADPPGAMLGSFDSIELNNFGDSSFNHFLDGTSGTNDDSGVYFNDKILIQEGTVSNNPGFSGPTPFIGFFETKLNDLNQIAVMASVDDPGIASTVDRAIVLLQVDAAGNILSEVVVAKEADVLFGQTEAVTDFGTGPHSLALNDNGLLMFVADLTGDTTTDGVVYLGPVPIAQEGQPSPIAGRNWRLLPTSTRVDLNNSGAYVMTGTLDGDTATDLVIATAGGAVAQEGSNLTAPGFESFTYVSFGSGPVCIADTNEVLYYAVWNGPATATNRGLFLDGELLVQQGVDTVDGVVIQTLRGVQDGYKMSDNGRYILFEAVLEDGNEGVFMIDRSSSALAIAGCTPSGSALAAPSGGPTVGGSLHLEISTTTYATALPYLAISAGSLDVGGGCGIPVPGFGGELLLDISNPLLVETFLPPFTGAPVVLVAPMPSDLGLVGFTVYAQVVMVDTTLTAAVPFEFSNALALTFGL